MQTLIVPFSRILICKKITEKINIYKFAENKITPIVDIFACHNKKTIKLSFIYSILYKPCIFKAYRLLNVQTLCIFPCFCPYEPKQGKFFILRRLPYPAVLRKYALLPL